ncbi:MAG: helix-hairpin-helix domain-containing protein [Anaerolineales bacterium]|nr:helix-hairpin-helix domain-containing protein [Anaerolineales bacterium]
MKNAIFVLLGVMAGFALAGVLVFVSRAPAGQAITLEAAPTEAPIAVHVIGAVPRPGLYEFSAGARVQDAIDAAGGLLASANVDGVNLAALLMDGQQLEIPYGADQGQTPRTIGDSDVELPTAEASSSANSELININTANLEELDSLPGIGPTTAQKIIDYREANGPFNVIEDITNVSGVGPATFEEIKDLITV